MDTEDLEPRAEAPKPKDLTVLSIEALNEYIVELESEIARVRVEIDGKEDARTGAETFFKT